MRETAFLNVRSKFDQHAVSLVTVTD